jgi:glycosyltransferase 2 family protein
VLLVLNRLRKLSLGFALLGLLVGTLLVGWYGVGRIVSSVLSVGAAGFSLLCVWQIALTIVLGSAWYTIAPLLPKRRVAVFAWGRMVREAAANCLPFSQVGGIVLGACAIKLYGIPWRIGATSTLVDLVIEFLTEIGFGAFGLLIVLARSPLKHLTIPVALTLIAIAIPVVLWQIRRGAAAVLTGLASRIGLWFGLSSHAVAPLWDELSAMCRRTDRLVIAVLVHLLAWVGKGTGLWICFRLLGADLDLLDALAIEGLLHLTLAAAFFVPGYIGVQEAAFVTFGMIFGLSPEISLAVSLLRRSRDLALGIPILVGWQVVEMRRLHSVAHT